MTTHSREVAYAFNPSTHETETVRSLEASLVYKESSGIVRDIQRNKKQKQKQKQTKLNT